MFQKKVLSAPNDIRDQRKSYCKPKINKYQKGKNPQNKINCSFPEIGVKGKGNFPK